MDKWIVEKCCGNWYITPPCGEPAHTLTVVRDGDRPNATFADVLNVLRDRGPVRGTVDCPYIAG